MAELIHLKDMQRDDNSVVTVGTFDGVHVGHQTLMRLLVERASTLGGRSVVVTFDPHPQTIITPKNTVPLLTSLRERAEILAGMGVDVLCVIPFTRDFSLLNSHQFVHDVVHRSIGIHEFVIGYDHHFGRDRAGSIEVLHSLSSRLGFHVRKVPPAKVDDATVSSTAIRSLLRDRGDVRTAAQWLSRPYALEGMVVHGNERGRKIGFPTANLRPDPSNKLIPKDGIYAVRASLDGKEYNGMMNIGVRPTFDGVGNTLEVNLFDFNRLIYGRILRIYFVERLRDERKFAHTQALVEQLHNDCTKAKRILDKCS